MTNPRGKLARLQAEILAGHKGAALLVPFDPEEVWGIAPAQVSELPGGKQGWLVRGSLAGTSWGRRFVLTPKELLARAKVRVGETVEVTLAPRKLPRGPAGS